MSMLQAYCERCHEALSISALRETSGTAKVSRTSKEKPNGLLNTACSSAVPLLPLTNSPFGWKSPTAIFAIIRSHGAERANQAAAGTCFGCGLCRQQVCAGTVLAEEGRQHVSGVADLSNQIGDIVKAGPCPC